MKKKSLIWVVPVGLIMALLSFLYIRRVDKKPSLVKTAMAKEGEIRSYLSITGTIKSKNSKEYFGTQSKIKRIYVKVGDKVKKGDVLIELDIPSMDESIKQGEIQYENALLQNRDLINQKNKIGEKIRDLDNKIKELENNINPNILPELQALKTQRENIQNISDEKIKQSQNSVTLAKISLDSLRKKKEETKDKIIADIDGVITAINGGEGAIINGMTPTIVIEDVQDLKAIISLGKYDINKVKVGQEVIIRGIQKNYSGKVSMIEPAAKKVTSPLGGDKTLDASIDILEKVDDLKIDFDVDIDILTGKVDKALKIPAECIRSEKGGKNMVYIFKEGKAVEREVKVGFQSDTEIEILEGVSLGEKVILNPSSNITNETVVKES